MHLDEVAPKVVGSIEEWQRIGRTYLYDRFRIGTEMKARCLGEVSPNLRDRLARAADLNLSRFDAAPLIAF